MTHTNAQHSSLDLDGRWDLSWQDGPADTPAGIRSGTSLAGTVPGQVHTDLMAAGLLEDPDTGFGELDQYWIGHSTWTYTRTFSWPATGGTAETPETQPEPRTFLVADGLDTFAVVHLNGQEIAHTANQHVGWRWDVTDLLAVGENILSITFGSAWDAAHECERAVGELPRPYDEPYAYVRKSACNFGWDWGPHYITAGIWQPIRLETWSGARIASVRPAVELTGISADGSGEPAAAAADVRVTVGVDLPELPPGAAAPGLTLTAVLTDPEGRESARATVPVDSAGDTSVQLSVAAPRLWWPAGLGAQPLYGLRVEVQRDGTVLSAENRRLGLRTVAVDESPVDADKGQPGGGGSPTAGWAIVVNGRRVRIRGYNWIPDDPFIAEVTDERLGQRLDQAVDGGANLLRVWGGGYFSTEAFMNGCDERGLMVWHDFLFACSAYDESPEMVASVTREAEQAVARLAAHPSLVLWCGGNECVWGDYDWGWREILQGRPWGAKYYTEVLPGVIDRVDPGRPYLPNSPWSGSLDVHPNDPGRGPVHIWTVWNNLDYAHYRDADPAFVSEMGWCAPPAWSTLRSAVTEGELLPENPQVAHHMRADRGMEKLARGIQPYFGVPDTAEDWHYLAQVVQSRSQSAGAEWLRSRGRCAGVVIWQLNDCWPVLSWSAVDGAGIEKPVFFGLRRSFAPELVTIVPVAPGGTDDPTGTGGLELVAVNDGTGPWTADVRVRRLRADGTEVAAGNYRLQTAADSTSRVRLDSALASSRNGTEEFLVADYGPAGQEQRALWFFTPDAAFDAEAPRFTSSVELAGGALHITVRAETLLRDVCLFADRLAADLKVPAPLLQVDDMMRTILPGEAVTFTVSRRDGGTLDTAPPAAGAWPVLRCIGDSNPEGNPGGSDSSSRAVTAGTAVPAGSVRRQL